ncbi:metalloprotease [Talaromyces pinophilus]|uniref:Dipeptidyl peptidase 3 n=1 Tax=Talaromyces pinophilus TaxID=128442 RepID=A0A6V8HBK3_TALPI|nr:metalloprotease [Talaromyces pinophilus]
MFATEPITASLGGLLKEKDSQEGGGGGGSRPSRYMIESPDGTRRRREVEIDELEIQKGLLQIAKGLEFLHESAGLVHGNLNPEAIYINIKSDWKIAGLSFAGPPDGSTTQSSLPPLALSEVLYQDPRLPPSVQLNMDYTSPDFVMDSNVSPAADLFSLGLIIVALYNSPHTSPLQAHSNASTYKKLLTTPSTTPSQSNSFLCTRPIPKDLLGSVLPRLITRRPAQRLNAREFQQSAYFDNILVSTIRFLESLPAKTQNEKSQFMRGLQRVIPEFPPSVLEKKVLGALLEETKDRDLLPPILQNIFHILTKVPNGRRVCPGLIIPKLKEIFLAPVGKGVAQERDTTRDAGLMVVLENLNVIAENCTGKDFKEDILPLVQLAMESSTHSLVDAAMKTLPVMLPVLDFSTVKNDIFPPIASTFSKTNSLNIKIRALEAFVVLCGGTDDRDAEPVDDLTGIVEDKKKVKKSSPSILDKYTVQEKLVPLLKAIKTKEPGVMMAALGVFRQVGKIVDTDFIAIEVLPTLWAFSLGPLLNIQQFEQFMTLIKSLSTKVEREQLRKLRELSSREDSSVTRQTTGGALGISATSGVEETSNDFERLVLGRKGTSNLNGDGGWDSLTADNVPIKPATQVTSPTFSWSSNASQTVTRPSISGLASTGHTSRSITPDSNVGVFSSLEPIRQRSSGASAFDQSTVNTAKFRFFTLDDNCNQYNGVSLTWRNRIQLLSILHSTPSFYSDTVPTETPIVGGDWRSLAEKTGVESQDLQYFLEYSAQFLGNCGNYKGFGDSKFIPRLNPDAFKKLASITPETQAAFEKANSTGGGIYETSDVGLMHLGYPDKGHLTTYYPDSPNITKDDITAVGDFLEKKGLPVENTRLRKTAQGDFELLIASGLSSPPSRDRDLGEEDSWTLEAAPVAGKKLSLVFGDYQDEMSKIAHSIKQAELNAANDTQKKMLEQYAKSFDTGSIEAYKESQRLWVKDQKPAVETDLGFVETYRDPHGVRGEWEGFVSMVNLVRTRTFSDLVNGASQYIVRLPWDKEFEKDKFLSPDFTSLEVLTFAGSGIPAGINIPNYDDIRQNLGFKNVSLGNVLSAKAPNEPVPFIAEKDLEKFQKYRDEAFEVQVGLHELLGHGTGKLLQETAPGVYNFDVQNPPVSPITKKPVSTWYKPGQTWSSVFGAIASSYEECRAECVAMALSCDFDILKIFGHGDGQTDINNDAGDVLYVAYLQMARAGVVALEFWDPKSHKWGQAHMQARYSILRTFLDAGDDFVKLVHTKEDLSDLEIHLDRSKILSHGRPAVESYLQKLHVYKSTADVVAGTQLYNDITSVDDWWGTKVRNIVLQKKVPRKVFVQANTQLEALTISYETGGAPPTALPSIEPAATVEDFSYISPPAHPPLSEASSSSHASPRPPPFSSLYFAPDPEVNRFKAAVTEDPGASSLPAFTPPPRSSSLLLPPPEDLDESSSVVAETKAALESVEKKGESSSKTPDDREPPPPYTEGYSPLQSFSYVMAAAGGAASIITQVQQTGGPPINTLGDVNGDEHITLDLRGTRFTLSRDELLTLPEFVLLSLFPNGLLPDGHMGGFHDGDIYPVDYDPNSLQYMLDFFRTVAQSIPSASPSPSGSPDMDASDSMYSSTRDMLQDRAGIIVLREDLDFYVIPPRPNIGQAEMMAVKRAAAQVLLRQDGIFSGLRKSDEVGSTEQHLIEMLTAGGFNHQDSWGHRAPEPNKAVICSLALAKLRTDIRGDINSNVSVGMAQKLLLFWRKPARRCWWEGIELDGVDGVEGKLKVWIRRVWTLEMSVIGLR